MKIPINNFLDTTKDGTLWYDENYNMYVTINGITQLATNNTLTNNISNYQLLTSFTTPYPISNIDIDTYNYIHILTNNGGIGYLYAYNLSGTAITSTNAGSAGSIPASGLAILPLLSQNSNQPIIVCNPNNSNIYLLTFSPSSLTYTLSSNINIGGNVNAVIPLPNGNIALALFSSGYVSIVNPNNLTDYNYTFYLGYAAGSLTYDSNSNVYAVNNTGKNPIKTIPTFAVPSIPNSYFFEVALLYPVQQISILKTSKNNIYGLDTTYNALQIYNTLTLI
ncbi:MAG: hypothetical protein QXI16_00100 [Sulfolobaceae archaeon]